jgi:hypothetical protein
LEEEVKNTVFQIEHNKTLGSDGSPAEFYHFREIIKADFLELFGAFHIGQLELFPINFCEIILLPNFNEAEMIQQYRTICLLSVCFKIFTKAATIKLNSVVDHVVHPT